MCCITYQGWAGPQYTDLSSAVGQGAVIILLMPLFISINKNILFIKNTDKVNIDLLQNKEIKCQLSVCFVTLACVVTLANWYIVMNGVANTNILLFLFLRKGSKIELIIFAEFSARGYPPPPLRRKIIIFFQNFFQFFFIALKWSTCCETNCLEYGKFKFYVIT